MAGFAPRLEPYRTGLRVYNTRTKQVEEFEPLVGRRVFMFVCGPTVYDYTHLGHARVFVFYDTLAKYLRWLGYSLFYIVNITDVDDKIVNRAAEEGVHPLELAARFERYFLEDMAALGVDSPNLYPKASDYLKEIFDQIRVLLEKGYAYVTPTGVYYDITKFPHYGELSGRRPEELRVHRIEPDPNKRNPGDFALWRVRPREEFGWESPWGYGRPGWHIEDTAITLRHFGPQYDIHGGAIELIFPHHEAEVAQAEAYTGVRPFVKYWVHTGLLLVEGKKMSKSLGNYVTVRDALERYSPNAIRVMILSHHYRGPIDFSWELLDKAEKAVGRVEAAAQALSNLEVVEDAVEGEEKLVEEAERRLDAFKAAMNADLQTPGALAALYGLSSAINRYANRSSRIGKSAYETVTHAFSTMASVLGIRPAPPSPTELGQLVELILRVRNELRKRKMYELSDWIREELRALGIEVMDTKEGSRWVIRK